MRPRSDTALAQAAACVAACVALAGCGTNTKDQVRQKVDQFIDAVTHRHYATLCNQVFAPSLLSHLTLYRINCETAMSLGFGKVQNPTLAIGGITIRSSRASVTVITTATGQEASLTAIQLTDTPSGWRVSSLGTPVIPPHAAARKP